MSEASFLIPALVGVVLGALLTLLLTKKWPKPHDAISATADLPINSQLNALRDQRNEWDAVLSSMSEIVIAINLDRRIINLNPAAEKLIGFKLAQVKGMRIEERLRNTEIQQAVNRIIENRDSVEQQITWFAVPEKELLLKGSTLFDAQGQPIGALLVLNEITELKRLETIRRDFVANVSHELKTPITSIKGFVETLIDGAINNPVDAARFLEIIKRQTERMSAIIDDLLTLSSVEQEDSQKTIRFKDEDVEQIIKSALEVCESKAVERNVSIIADCPAGLHARINATLIEQALINLIDNAIKYGGDSPRITVTATSGSGVLQLAVRDFGPGIEKVHQDRLFERFYRIDQGRTRNKGGTGLGLAIVKHIAQVHNGQAAVSSTLGEGSTFTISIPV